MRAVSAVLATALGCTAPGPADPCALDDGALERTAFVIVTEPAAGSRVADGFRVSGCSSTFENLVLWRLEGRDGRTLASGHTTGGGVDGPARFSTTVRYRSPERQLGHLVVFEEDVSDGEGFPPGRTVVPLVLGADP